MPGPIRLPPRITRPTLRGAAPPPVRAAPGAAPPRAVPAPIPPRAAPALIPPRADSAHGIVPGEAATALARAQAILAELESVRDGMAALAHRVGTLLIELDERPELVLALGHGTFEDLLVERKLMARPTALKYMAIARCFDAEHAKELGVEKSYAIVRYAREVKGDRETPLDLVRANPLIARIPLLQHTSASLDTVIRDWQARRAERAASSDDTAIKTDGAVRMLGARLRALGAGTAKLKRVRKGAGYKVRIELDPDEAIALAGKLVRG